MENEHQRLLNELKNNPRVKEYLSAYDEKSREQFLEDYVQTKKLLLDFGEDWRKFQDKNAGHFRACAEHFYWQIAQKKLFNLQCLWRAEQISLPVAISWEFNYWSGNIKSCPFIEDITEKEIDTMIAYLEQAPYNHEDYDPWAWQAYDEFKDEATGIGAGDSYPAWYEFYDNRFGTHQLLALPDLRGEEEERYLAAWRDHALTGLQDSAPRKPVLFSGSTEDFIRKTEPYKILDYYRLYQQFSERKDALERMEDELELMREETGEVEIPAGKFPDAIFQAGHNLKVAKMKALLPEVHQGHLERKAMGISYEQEGTVDEDSLVVEMKARINEGRRLLGEA